MQKFNAHEKYMFYSVQFIVLGWTSLNG